VVANGEPAVLASRDGVPVALWTVEATDSGVAQLFIVLNPEKLSRFASLS
jgi:RNA polymerase sigma-70 factor (ECF subfamily)